MGASKKNEFDYINLKGVVKVKVLLKVLLKEESLGGNLKGVVVVATVDLVVVFAVASVMGKMMANFLLKGCLNAAAGLVVGE